MSNMSPEEKASARVDAKLASNDERLERRYSSNSAAAQRSTSQRANFLQSRALGGRSGRTSAHRAR